MSTEQKIVQGCEFAGFPNQFLIITMFSAIFYHRWSKDEFTQGAYSEPVVGTTSQDFKNLGARLGRLYFAGEATSEDWYGYMQGAYLSGKEKGQMIADHIMGVSAEADDILEDDAVVHEEL